MRSSFLAVDRVSLRTLLGLAVAAAVGHGLYGCTPTAPGIPMTQARAQARMLSPKDARLVFYRAPGETQVMGAVEVDDEQVGNLPQLWGGYLPCFMIDHPAGRASIGASSSLLTFDPDPVSYDLEPGRTYYFEYVIEHPGGGILFGGSMPEPRLIPLPAEQAEPNVSGCRYLGPLPGETS